MASFCQVRAYLAQWFQLGKRARSHSNDVTYCPKRVFWGESYSAEFETCWQQILQNAHDTFLEGTDQSIAELLDEDWEIGSCARCDMPVPTSKYQWTCLNCPCSDMTTWPNESLPKPRVPAQTQSKLRDLCARLESIEVHVS